MIGDAPRSHITGVPGWESAAEQEALHDLAKSVVPEGGLIVEIGAEYGMSASLFAHAAKKDVQIFSVDVQEDWGPYEANLTEAKLFNRITDFFSVPSVEAVADLRAETKKGIDLLFIDGDHTEDGVTADIETWIPLVKKGGVVAFHDYAGETNKLPHPSHHDVRKAVDRWTKRVGKDWKQILMVDSLVVFQKV